MGYTDFVFSIFFVIVNYRLLIPGDTELVIAEGAYFGGPELAYLKSARKDEYYAYVCDAPSIVLVLPSGNAYKDTDIERDRCNCHKL